jgi:hypothetical protein
MKPPVNWLIKSCKPDPRVGYWVTFISEDCLTPGKEWEEYSCWFYAPFRKGQALARSIVRRGPMTTETLHEIMKGLPDSPEA